jgi:hypothetical protein
MKTNVVSFLAIIMVAFLLSFAPKEKNRQISSYVDATLQGGNSNCGWMWARCGDGAIFYTQTIPIGTQVGNIYRVERVRKNKTICYEWDVVSVQPLSYCNIW